MFKTNISYINAGIFYRIEPFWSGWGPTLTKLSKVTHMVCLSRLLILPEGDRSVVIRNWPLRRRRLSKVLSFKGTKEANMFVIEY